MTSSYYKLGSLVCEPSQGHFQGCVSRIIVSLMKRSLAPYTSCMRRLYHLPKIQQHVSAFNNVFIFFLSSSNLQNLRLKESWLATRIKTTYYDALIELVILI